MDIAYSAERSIEDAIEELSQGETYTVIISYSVMFIYVAVALGNFKSFATILVRIRINNNDLCTLFKIYNFHCSFIQN